MKFSVAENVSSIKDLNFLLCSLLSICRKIPLEMLLTVIVFELLSFRIPVVLSENRNLQCIRDQYKAGK